MFNLWDKLNSALATPFDPRDEETNRTNVISGLMNLGLLLLILYLIPAIPTRGVFSFQVISGMMMIGFVFFLRFAITKGHTGTISLFLLSATWLFVTVILLFYENGLRAPAYSIIMAYLIVFTGMLHSPKAAIILTAVTIITNLLVVIGELQGFYLTEPKIPDVRWALFGQIIFLSGITFLINRTLGNLKQSISLYRNESEERHLAELDVRRLNEKLEIAYETTLEGWSQALELRDKETEGHSRRVTELSMNLGRQMGLDESEIISIRYGALLHDIGKMGIPDKILRKNGSLTSRERQIVEQHPDIAYDLLKDIEFLKNAIEIPYSHHEKWDGKGYPQKLKGEKIPLYARIFAVVDYWDALSTDRPYRKAWPLEKVVSYIQEQAGKTFDPHIVKVFLNEVVNLK
jgi:putative nucleotidyltransferase with HDIG domain